MIAVASATDGADVARGVVLVIAYCLGWESRSCCWPSAPRVRCRGLAGCGATPGRIQIFGGVLLILVGLALVTGLWNDFVSWVRDAFVSDVDGCRYDECCAFGYARNTWRTLTSMGTALVLLFLLALGRHSRCTAAAAQPEPGEGRPVHRRTSHHRTVAGPAAGFQVFSSFWFTAIYVLLFISLVGCLTPRLVEHARSLRATPVAAPRNLARLPKHHTAEVSRRAPTRSPPMCLSACGAGAASPTQGRRNH